MRSLLVVALLLGLCVAVSALDRRTAGSLKARLTRRSKAKDSSGSFRADFFKMRRGIHNLPSSLNSLGVVEFTKYDKVINYRSTGRHWAGVPSKFSNNFAVQWTGTVNIKTAGSYKFWTRSDDGSKLFINSKLVVNNDNPHGMRSREGTINLPTGSHDVLIQFFENGGGAGIIVKWKGPDTGNGWKLLNSATSSEPSGDDVGKWSAEYWNMGRHIGKLADTNLDSFGTPQVTREETYIWYASTGGKWEGLPFHDRFAGRWTGTLRIQTAGKYNFWTVSDDGSQLLIDGKLVVDNDRPHGMRERGGSTTLTAGDHEVIVTFFENGGGAGIYVSWSGPDTSNTRIKMGVNKAQPILGMGADETGARDVQPAEADFCAKTNDANDDQKRGECWKAVDAMREAGVEPDNSPVSSNVQTAEASDAVSR